MRRRCLVHNAKINHAPTCKQVSNRPQKSVDTRIAAIQNCVISNELIVIEMAIQRFFDGAAKSRMRTNFDDFLDCAVASIDSHRVFGRAL